MCRKSDFGTVETLYCSPDHLFIEVAEHLRVGLYHVVGMNISSSSLVMLCETGGSLQDFQQALSRIPSHLTEFEVGKR